MQGKSYNTAATRAEACLDDDLLYRYLEKLATEQERRTVERHLQACRECFSDFAALARMASTPATEAEKTELAQLPGLTPEEQINKIFDYLKAEGPAPDPVREVLDNKFVFQTKKKSWPKLWSWLPSPQLAPRFAYVMALFLILAATSFIGIPFIVSRFDKSADTLAEIQRELQTQHKIYVNPSDYAVSAPRLSGGYAPERLFLMGPEEETASRLDNSRRRLEAVTADEAKAAQARQLLAQTFIIQGAFAQADSVLRQIPTASRQQAGLLNDRGVLRLAMNDFSAAAHDFEAAINADPKLVEARYNLALTKAKMGLIAEALVIFNEYLNLETKPEWRDVALDILEELQKEKK
ncbi:MAG: tetratricopeptide repeat protein [candidate division KSB1 bacterium]|nr:tetratricopeptide repeat protein [candidate division KSB1 bacterium]MDZ7367674.1 tetratricopeptide repeat protein [candidate division KSB1 bacterium]MDZ7404811.1 tetratricopeptide repeat protein [candidate division KSB1 bacterium]